MEIKNIVEKALRGEDYSTDVESLPVEEQTAALSEINKSVKEATKAEQEKLIGLRQAIKANEEKGKEKSNDFERLKEDYFNKAKENFFSDPDFKLDEVQKAAFLEEYKKFNSGAIESGEIIRDFKKTYAAMFATDLLEARKKVLSSEKGAAQYNANSVNANGGVNSPENDKYSKEAKDLFIAWKDSGMKGKTLDDAQSIVESGSSWRGRDLSK